jgi:CBS domain-containing protein
VKVGEIMRRDVVTVGPDVPIADAVDIMLERGVSELVAVDPARRVMGVVTEADIIARCAFHGPDDDGRAAGASAATWRNRWRVKAAGTTVGQLMSSPAVTTTPDATVASSAARMVTLALKRLPVVDGAGHLVGLVSQRDVLRTLAHGSAPRDVPAPV